MSISPHPTQTLSTQSQNRLPICSDNILRRLPAANILRRLPTTFFVVFQHSSWLSSFQNICQRINILVLVRLIFTVDIWQVVVIDFAGVCPSILAVVWFCFLACRFLRRCFYSCLLPFLGGAGCFGGVSSAVGSTLFFVEPARSAQYLTL